MILPAKITRFADIPQFTPDSSQPVDVSWPEVESTLSNYDHMGTLDLDPDFQRGHVWDESKRIRYVEFILRGGRSSRTIFFNCATWKTGITTPVVLVDGKQRLEAVRLFMRNELRAFGSLRSEFTDRLPVMRAGFVFNVNNLKTRRETLQWYLDLNDGGVVHSQGEIDRVKALLCAEPEAGR